VGAPGWAAGRAAFGCGKPGVVNCQTAGTGWYSINSSMNSTTQGWIKTKASCRIWGEHPAKPAIVGLGLRWPLEKKDRPLCAGMR
jgi:hypothetical protein